MFDSIKFIAAYEQIFSEPIGAAAAANLRLLAGELAADPAITDDRWRAYALATVRRECGEDYAVRSEHGSLEYFDRYEPPTSLARQLGNTSPGDGYRFRGRGYVQVTGRHNYSKFSELLHVDLAGDPDRALDPKLAYSILSAGMVRGLFTGVGFARFISGDRCDFVAARKIINGQDHAEEIAAAAVKFEQAWKEAIA